MNEILNKENKVAKLLSYAQQHINDIIIFKESNIENLKKIINSQIDYINKNIQEEYNKKIDNILSSLDKFFKIDFSSENSNSCCKDIKKFKENIKIIKAKIIEVYNENENTIKVIFINYKKDIKDLLDNKLQNIENILRNNDYEKIIKEIDKYLENKIIKLNELMLF